MKKRLITVGLIISLLMNVVVISQNFIIKKKTERYKISLLNSVIEGRMAGHDERIDALERQVGLLYARGLNYISDREALYNVFQDFRVLLNGIEDRGIYGSRDFEYKISQFEDLIEEFLRSVKTEALKEFAEKEGYMSE